MGHSNQRSQGGKQGWMRYWYSPEVKMWVKREIEKTDFWTPLRGVFDSQLISYELKK